MRLTDYLPPRLTQRILKEKNAKPITGEMGSSGNSMFNHYNAFIGGDFRNNVYAIPDSIILKMRKHPTVFLATEFIKLPLIAHQDWSVECDDPEIKAFAESILWSNWRQIMRLALLAVDFGRSPNEIIWYEKEGYEFKYKEDGAENETVINSPSVWDFKLKDLYPEWVEIKKDSALEPFYLKQNAGGKEVTIPPEKTFAYILDGYWQDMRGRSRLLSAYDAWYDHVILTQALNRYLERRGIPVPMGWIDKGKFKIPGKNSDEEQSALVWLKQMLDDIMDGKSISLAAEFSKDKGLQKLVDISFLEDSGKSMPQFIETLEYKDILILRGILVPEQTLTRGDVGSYSADEVKADMFLVAEDALMMDVLEYISNQLLHPLISYNYGSSYPSAKLVSQGLSQEKKKLLKEMLMAMLNGKQYRPTIEYLSTAHNIPLEEIEQQPFSPFGNLDYKEREIKKEDDKELKDKAIKLQDKLNYSTPEQSILRRELFDIEKMAGGVKRLTDNIRERQSIEDSFIRKVTDEILIPQRERIRISLNSALNRDNPPRYIGEIDLISLRKKYENILLDYFKQLFDIGVQRVIVEKQRLSEGKIELDETAKKIEVSLPQEVKGFITTQAQSISSSQYQKLKDVLTNIALNEWRKDTPKSEILFKVEEAIKAYTDLNIPRVANTMSTYMINNGRESAGNELGAVAAFYSSALIETTCPLCEFLDGHYINLNDPDYFRYSPPNHWNCYCDWVYIFGDTRLENYTINWESPPLSLVAEYKNLSEKLKAS